MFVRVFGVIVQEAKKRCAVLAGNGIGRQILRFVEEYRSAALLDGEARNDLCPSPYRTRMSMTRDIGLKLTGLLCIVSVIVALAVAHQFPAAGYELSIYSSTPALVWYLLLAGLVGGIGIVVHEMATERYTQSRTYLVGFAVILLATVAFLCLPYVRNYVSSTRADQLGHIGLLEDILWTGHISSLNPYPIAHTLLSQIALITGLSAFQAVNLNTALILPIFASMTYLLATAILPHRGQHVLAALVAGGTMAGIGRYYLIPNTWSILMLPLLFYCYFRSDRVPFKVLLMVLLVAYPFFHPLSSLLVIVALAAMEIPKPLYSRLLRRLHVNVPPWMASRPVLWPILLESAIFAPWVLTRPALAPNVRQFWRQLTTFSGSQQLQKTGTDMGKAGLTALDAIVIALKLYGEILILVSLAVVGLFLLTRQLRSGDKDPRRHRLLLVGLLLLLACLFYAAFFVGIPGTQSLAGDRILIYVEVASIPLVAFALWEVSSRTKHRLLTWGGIYGLIVLVAMLNVAAHYSSPYVVRPSEHVTQRDMTGMTWYLEEKDPMVYSYYVVSPPTRFAQCLLGNAAMELREDIKYESTQFTDHFCYFDSSGSDNCSTLGEQYSGPIYVNIHKYDKIAYQTVWQNLNRFNDVDFQKLEQDPTVDRIYSNGEVDILFVTQPPKA